MTSPKVACYGNHAYTHQHPRNLHYHGLHQQTSPVRDIQFHIQEKHQQQDDELPYGCRVFNLSENTGCSRPYQYTGKDISHQVGLVKFL